MGIGGVISSGINTVTGGAVDLGEEVIGAGGEAFEAAFEAGEGVVDEAFKLGSGIAELGDEVYEWGKDAYEYIERIVRAMQPWPTSYTFLHRPGKEPMRVIVNRVKDGGIACTSFLPQPPEGLILRLQGEFQSVAGNGTLLQLDELQPAGKKKMTAEEFLRGYPIVEGMRFGPEVLS